MDQHRIQVEFIYSLLPILCTMCETGMSDIVDDSPCSRTLSNTYLGFICIIQTTHTTITLLTAVRNMLNLRSKKKTDTQTFKS